MVKSVNEGLADFGKRLAELRKRAGFTQAELGEEIGVTQRVIAYYEGETKHPPAALLPTLARVLNVSADELLGIKPIKQKKSGPDSRLVRRIQQIDKLDPATKRQVMQVIDTYLEAAQLKKHAS